MRVIIIGSGGREHALAWKISASPLCSKLFISPGNPGTAAYGENVVCDICDPAAVVSLVQSLCIDLLVIGPEAALANGVADAVRAEVSSCHVFGPTKAGARLEWSKAYAKTFMNKYGIPTADTPLLRPLKRPPATLRTVPCPSWSRPTASRLVRA